MTEKEQAMEIKDQQQVPSETTERTRDWPCFVPRADIFETDDAYLIKLDMPGVDENKIDITLEKNTLTINGYSNVERPEGYSLAAAEYRIGDYERSFRLTDKINQEDIEASYQDGVLKLNLPKAEEAKARKIQVKVG
ncbi:MAG: Hsp20/alpha crystallin family protein [Anaerolineales bacterium]|nr:Hsp20/alpha crystallin family protein [Anaerolineales bacterium]MDZ7844613.1 Hsp20/alpha crystallin family protein [Anaerolineales bacterium]